MMTVELVRLESFFFISYLCHESFSFSKGQPRPSYLLVQMHFARSLCYDPSHQCEGSMPRSEDAKVIGVSFSYRSSLCDVWK